MNNTEYNYMAYIDDAGMMQFQPIHDQNKDVLLKSLKTENRVYMYTAKDHVHAELEAITYYDSVKSE